MNLYGRLLALLLRLWVRRRPLLGPGEACRTSFRVWPQDLDINLHMNNGRYLTLMDLGRLDFIARTGLLLPIARKGWLPVLGAAEITFLRPLPPLAVFEIETTMESWDEKWMVIKQSFHCKGKVAAVGRVRALFRKGRSNVPSAELLALSPWAGLPAPHSKAEDPL